MARFIGIENGIKALNAIVQMRQVPALSMIMGWDAKETERDEEDFRGLTIPEAETQMTEECPAVELEDVNYCYCGRHQWDANAFHGLGDVVVCGINDPWRVEKRG
jgi:hypothetical protein